MKTKIKKSFSIILLAFLGLSFYANAQAPVLLKDSVGNSNATNGLVIGNNFYFNFSVSTNRQQLWKTDGTPSGTQMLKDSFASILNLVNINSTLYFMGYVSSTSRALWKTDGTKAGTIMVKDFLGTYAQAVGFTTINNVCYFNYQSSSAPFAIWKTDGTDAGTVLVKSGVAIAAGMPRDLFYLAGTQIVFFGTTATSTSKYRELWKTDGTDAGTSMIKDSIFSPNAGNVIGEYLNVGSLGFFTVSSGASYSLWRTDGTTAGTFIVGGGLIANLTNLNGVLYFRNGSGISALWKSDGTLTGTTAISGLDKIGSGMSVMGNSLYLGGKNSYDFEPYKSDGTLAGTVLLKDIRVGSLAMGSSPTYFTKVNNTMCFVANDSINGNQIWKTDGTTTGTKMAYAVADTISSNEAPVARIALNNYLLFIHGGSVGKLYSLLVASGSAGINTTEETKNIVNVYPNPSSGIVKIECNSNKNISVQVFNLLGEEVVKQQMLNEVDMSNSPKGIYFLRVNDGTKIHTRKIIIQ